MSQGERISNQETPNKNVVYQSLNAKKKEYEGLWKSIYIIVTLMSAFLLDKVYKYQTYQEFQQRRKGNLSQLLMYGVSFSVVFICYDLITHYLLDNFYQKHILTQERYSEIKARKKRSYTLVKWSYSMGYYLATSIIAYLLLKDTSFFPGWLGGSGSCHKYFSYTQNFTEYTFHMKIFYVIQFGKHFARTFIHMFIHAEGNYYEYILHHALSTFLILFSYLTNLWLVGIMVLLCHDLSDLFLTLARTYKDCKFCNQIFLKVLYAVGFLTWIGTRIIIFPITCVYCGFANFRAGFLEKVDIMTSEVLTIPYFSLITMLGILFILQIFWTYYIVQSFASVNISKKVTHNYD